MKYLTTLTTLFLHVMAYSAMYAATYYVSDSGDNANSGTIDEPWQTIQFALDAASPGDTVLLLTGTYFERVVFNQSGITLSNAPGESAIIDGTGTTGGDALIQITDQDSITVSGLVLTNHTASGAQGILVSGNCRGIRIMGNDISQIHFGTGEPANEDLDNAQPIIVYGDDPDNAVTGLLISGNQVHDCNTGYSEGIAVNGNVDGFEIISNTVTNITNIGIDAIGGEGTATANDQARNGVIMDNDVKNCKSPYAPAAGIYVDGGMNIVIESNLVTGCQWGIEVGCENQGFTASGITVKNNFIYDNDDAAIAVGGYDYPNTGRVTNSIIRNNTALSNDASPAGPGGSTGQLTITATDNVVIFNNIFYKTNGDPTMISVETGSTGLSLNYNLYYSPGSVEFFYEGMTLDSLEEFQLGTGQDANSIFADPKLQSAVPGVNFHLANASSPAINAGDPATSITPGELDGYKDDERINDDTIDIGADEFGSILPVSFLKPFDVELKDRVVHMDWVTAEEINNDHFQIERSRDLITWEPRGKIAAKGVSSSYHTTDPDPWPGASYYRLRQVDLDGQFELSSVYPVYLAVDDIALYPNPATDYFILSTTRRLDKIVLTDLAGRSLGEWRDFKEQLQIPVEGLRSGMYVLRLYDRGEIQLRKLLIQ